MKNNIRISGGMLKGKKIPFDFKDTLRPTSNKLKEIIFNWLQFEIQDCVCWYKATLRKHFRVGSPQLWNMHKKMYNPKHINQIEQDAKKTTKKTKLTITKKK